MTKVIDISDLFDQLAKIEELPSYVNVATEIAGKGDEIVLTGKGPVWLYLSIAHALHGIAKKLIYRSPVTGDVVIFDHDPF
jgi:CRISPR-associated Csx3 family protein